MGPVLVLDLLMMEVTSKLRRTFDPRNGKEDGKEGLSW
jgi:hypothetical protein